MSEAAGRWTRRYGLWPLSEMELRIMVIRIITTICAFVLSLGIAQAETVNYGNSYFGIAGGIIAPQSTTFSFSGNVLEDVGGTVPHTGTAKISYDAGPIVSLVYGYRFTPRLAVEGTLDYSQVGLHTIDETFTTNDEGETDSGPTKQSGHVTTYLGMANVIYSPTVWRGVSPYLGVGAGISITRTSLGQTDPGRDDDGVHLLANTNRVGPAANAILGLDYDPLPQLTIGLRYRFLWIGNGGTNTAGGGFESIAGSAKVDDTMAHVFSVRATYRF